MDTGVTLILVVCQITGTSGWRSLIRRIPNADHVMNPCDLTEHWEGIGHLKPGGNGARNAFGVDFKRHGMTWTRDFCQLDSDGDGPTNGEELGDPDCTWKPGSDVAEHNENITHPGICEPLGSALCKDKNAWLSCENKFNCDVINDPATMNITIYIPRMEVPVKTTSHKCMLFEFPQDGDFHMVATTPYIDNRLVLHHILIYGCDNDKQPKHGVGEVFECEMTFDPACTDILAVWLLGMGGECLHDNTGFRIGTRGYKRAGLQIHWENQQLLSGLFDGSGMTVYYTRQLRMHDAGVLFIGQVHMIIPPGKKNHTEVGHCYSECSKRKWSEDLHITSAVNHMHYLGRFQSIEHLRDGEVIDLITNETDYNFDSPKLYVFKEPIVIRPSDEIRTTCLFDSSSRNVTTLSGAGYREEMCFGFLTFYPKQAITKGATICTSWKNIPHCRFELDDTVNGCDFKNVHNMSHPETKAIYDRVMEHCRPFGPCFQECVPVVKEITQLPCYHGDMWEWQRNKMGGEYDNKTETAQWYRFYAAIDSCLKTDYNEKFESTGNLENLLDSGFTIVSPLFCISLLLSLNVLLS